MKISSGFFLDLFFPPRCAFCGVILPGGKHGICPSCEKFLPYVERDKILRKIGNHSCVVTFYYEGSVRSGIHLLKFQKRAACARAFAPYLAQTVSELLAGEFDAVTFVPVSPQRRLRRGFDQSQLLARHAADLWGIKPETTLRKIRNNPPQSTVKTPQARRENVRNVFEAHPRASIAGRRFLLIDDITTSGSTLTVCSDLLLAAGAASVVCAALASGERTAKTREINKKSC